MKNFTLLLLLVTGISFTGCKKDKKDSDEANIVGKWYMQSSWEKEYKNGVLVDQQSSTQPSQTVSYEFRSNGTGLDNHGDQFNYKIIGTKLTVTYPDDDDDTEVQDIKKLTSSEMVLTGEDSWDNEGDITKYTWEGTFKKK